MAGSKGGSLRALNILKITFLTEAHGMVDTGSPSISSALPAIIQSGSEH